MIFKTERLIIRKLEPQDFPGFHEMQSDDEVMKYTTSDGTLGKGFSESENRRQLDDCIERYDQPGNQFWVWAIIEIASEQFVGTCAIVQNEYQEPEIGYRILRKFWRRGFATETSVGLIAYAIEEMKLDQLVAYVDQRNEASVKILNQSQMRFSESIANHGQTDLKFIWP